MRISTLEIWRQPGRPCSWRGTSDTANPSSFPLALAGRRKPGTGTKMELSPDFGITQSWARRNGLSLRGRLTAARPWTGRCGRWRSFKKWIAPTCASILILFTFTLAGDSIEACVRDLVPITGHTHITDAQRHADGSFDFRVLGDGELDSTAYMRAMAQAGWDEYITLEVSTRIWSQEGFDTVDTARRSYTALSNAFKEAGVPRD